MLRDLPCGLSVTCYVEWKVLRRLADVVSDNASKETLIAFACRQDNQASTIVCDFDVLGQLFLSILQGLAILLETKSELRRAI